MGNPIPGKSLTSPNFRHKINGKYFVLRNNFMERQQARKYARELDNLFSTSLRAFQAKNHVKLEGLDITFTQLLLLRILSVEPDQQMRSLAKKLGLGLPTTTGIVDRLVRSGLVKRHRDVEDRRIVRVSMTAKGREMLAKGMRQGRKETTAILVKMEESEGKEFVRLLTKFLELAIEETSKEGTV